MKLKKNYIRKGQKLPIWGIGPYMIGAMGAVGVIGIALFCFILEEGSLKSPWTIVFRIVGGFLIALGIAVWYIGAILSGMDDNIADNRLKTDGIYAWVRNPMYSGWWMFITGICLMWTIIWLLATFLLNWLIMTVVLKNTEEKWLLELYGDEYAEYRKRVNRCIPWFPGKQ
ncbi:MAG: isoprenylcysteine carboxylmethyltransferase family protein [Spirochaetales bacterium]|nr:isoprenylcysteine carboxylmethyltransferase family protein [Spirochaetales bacterium]